MKFSNDLAVVGMNFGFPAVVPELHRKVMRNSSNVGGETGEDMAKTKNGEF